MNHKDRIDAIARDLQRYRPVAATPTDGGDRCIFVFDIIPHHTLPWSKGIDVDMASASAESVGMLMEDWKASIRNAIASGAHSPTIQRAIAVHGIKAVREAMKPCPLH